MHRCPIQSFSLGRQFLLSTIAIVGLEHNSVLGFNMTNMLIALRIWGDLWQIERVTMFCDNRAVVDILGNNETLN